MPKKLPPKPTIAAITHAGVAALEDYFQSVTEELRRDVTAQIEDLRERTRRVEQMALLGDRPVIVTHMTEPTVDFPHDLNT